MTPTPRKSGGRARPDSYYLNTYNGELSKIRAIARREGKPVSIIIRRALRNEINAVRS